MESHINRENSNLGGGNVHDLKIDPLSSIEDDSDGRYNLLFVDDEQGVLKALRRVFVDDNYTVFTAGSAREGLEVLEKEKVQLVISDNKMPGMEGVEFLKIVRERWPDTIRIMLTGYADLDTIMSAVNEGAVYKFITKPWNDDDLQLTVNLALEQYRLIQENRKLKKITLDQQSKIKDFSKLVNQNQVVVGNIFVKTGVVKEKDLEKALKRKKDGELLSETLVRVGMTSESKVVRALQNHLKIDAVDFKSNEVNPEVVKFLPRDFCEKSRLIPISIDKRVVRIAMADPSDIFKCDNISLMTGLTVVPLVAKSSDILAQLDKVYGKARDEDPGEIESISDIDAADEIDIVIDEEDREVDVRELIGSSEIPPIVRVVNAILSEAIRYGASDIHIEAKSKYSVVRYRIDGILQDKIRIPSDQHSSTVSRIKILGKMDIAERRKPQDGRITVKSGNRMVDIRVSTLPTINGEKVVMRILDKSGAIKTLDELGVLPGDMRNIGNMIRKPQGVIISTGPTGSGKTTMLYSILNAMLDRGKNFETIEDPVEYFLDDANQVYVQEKIGLSFASVLRSTLRQDPDVILVGEIRDFETADVVFKAAQTGHTVLTTLHTNNAVASITRLIDVGVKPYIIASALEGIIAQRLVRKVCVHCASETEADRGILNMLRLTADSVGQKVQKGRGCDRCHQTGYLGRTGIFEILMMNNEFKHLISNGYQESELFSMAQSVGMKSLMDAGIEKVRQGETTLEELLRVIGPQVAYERKCAQCEEVIDAKYPYCPSCGALKENLCRHCSIVMEEGWKVCPHCGTGKTAEGL